MTISYVQAAEPIWYIVGLDGLAAGGAQMFTYDSLTRDPKPVYQDIGGLEAYTNPVIFDLNGTSGPFYWKLDSTAPDSLYFVQVFDLEGNLLWEIDDFPDSTGGGGGSVVTNYLDFTNYIANNQFIDHIPDQSGGLPTNLVIAPSNHKGFTPAQSNPLVGTYGVLGPDIRLVKSNNHANDSISFPSFALASFPLTNDTTPEHYVRYQSDASDESYKSFQFPITQKVKNLSTDALTFTIWAAVTATPKTIHLYARQYYGSGNGATAESGSTRYLLDNYDLTSTWKKFVTNFSFNSVAGKSLGTVGQQTDDDAVYLQLEMPLGEDCDILFTKPCLFLGTINPNAEFDTYDQIDSIDQTPRTGDVRIGLTSTAPLGWVAMNDGTIGNTGSGATNASGPYTFQLYSTIYTAVSDTWAPVSGGRTAPGNTMANAIADFIAGKTLKLPLSLGRALAGAGAGATLSSRDLGQNTGLEQYTLVSTNLPASWSGSISTLTNSTGTSGSSIHPGVSGTDTTVTFKTPGGSQPFSIMQPTSFMNIFIKL